MRVPRLCAFSFFLSFISNFRWMAYCIHKYTLKGVQNNRNFDYNRYFFLPCTTHASFNPKDSVCECIWNSLSSGIALFDFCFICFFLFYVKKNNNSRNVATHTLHKWYEKKQKQKYESNEMKHLNWPPTNSANHLLIYA